MGFSKSLKKIAQHTIAPVFSLPAKAIESATGMDWKQQLTTGAGIGLGGSILSGMTRGSAAGGIPGLQGGQPLTNGQIPTAGTSGTGIFRALGGQIGSTLLGAGASLYGANEQADAMRHANDVNQQIAQQQMQFSAGQAQQQMDFQERMSNTSYQRGIEDMKSAGINPMLAYDKGGASTPPGASGSSSGATVEPVPSVIANSMSSAMDLMRNYASAKSALSSARLADSQANLSEHKLPEQKTEGRVFNIINNIMDRIPFHTSATGNWIQADDPALLSEKTGIPERFIP